MFFAPVVHTRVPSPAFRSSDRGFERFVNDAFFSNAHQGFKVGEDEKAWTVTLDLPGVAKEELALTIEGSIVRIVAPDRDQVGPGMAPHGCRIRSGMTAWRAITAKAATPPAASAA
jgi:hypothetical protein